MSEEEFSQLQELIKQDLVQVEVSKRLSGAAFGGRIGGCLFPLILLSTLAGAIFFMIKGKFLYVGFCLIAGIVFFIVWTKLSFYYFYIRSIRDYNFFNMAYNSSVVRLHIAGRKKTISYPTPWNSVFTFLKE